ncbi:MAG: hypothetical protein ABIS29_00575 [Vicinamibacterales bacterium]
MTRHASAVAIALLFNTMPVLAQSGGAPASELIVKAVPADVHKSPTVASPVIGKALGGTVLEIKRNLGSWVEVAWPDTEAGIAFLHVNAGTIARRSAAAASNGAQEAVAQITAVAAAITASANSGARAGQRVAAQRAASYESAYVSLPSRRIGMGALMNPTSASNQEFGATARTWWGNRLGVQFNVSRPQLENTDGRFMSSTQFAPSVLYSLPDGVIGSMWLRPYLGAGPRLYRANLANHLGYEAFGGAEATLAAMPQFALSADVGYRQSRPSINGFEPRQVGFSVSGHWYVK